MRTEISNHEEKEQYFSDSETTRRTLANFDLSPKSPSRSVGFTNFLKGRTNFYGSVGEKGAYSKIAEVDENFSDNDIDTVRHAPSADEFGAYYGKGADATNKLVKTGRQRKKEAARSKFGEFQAQRRKKRLYFCCVGSEIDVAKLFESLTMAGSMDEWFSSITCFGSDCSFRYLKMYSDVLHLHKPGRDDPLRSPRHLAEISPRLMGPKESRSASEKLPFVNLRPPPTIIPAPSSSADPSGIELPTRLPIGGAVRPDKSDDEEMATRISMPGAQEVFVFDFGAVVFWYNLSFLLFRQFDSCVYACRGFNRGEEEGIMRTIRLFITQVVYIAPSSRTGDIEHDLFTHRDVWVKRSFIQERTIWLISMHLR
jgi:hypothetical protein